MDLKGYKICGCLAVAENEQEAIDMYIQNTGEEPYKQPEETDLDEWFTYFNLDDIKEEDIPHIYDKKHPPNKPIQASLKRPYARKYLKDGFYDQKSFGMLYI